MSMGANFGGVYRHDSKQRPTIRYQEIADTLLSAIIYGQPAKCRLKVKLMRCPISAPSHEFSVVCPAG